MSIMEFSISLVLKVTVFSHSFLKVQNNEVKQPQELIFIHPEVGKFSVVVLIAIASPPQGSECCDLN